MRSQYIRSILDSLLVRMTRAVEGRSETETENDITAAQQHTLQTKHYANKNITNKNRYANNLTRQ